MVGRYGGRDIGGVVGNFPQEEISDKVMFVQIAEGSKGLNPVDYCGGTQTKGTAEV